MSISAKGDFLWWVIPGVLAGMPLPFIHPERRMNNGGALNAYDDELPTLHSAGIRAVVSLLNIPSDTLVYESAGFSSLCLPVPDGGAPTAQQAAEFVRFVAEQREAHRPVAVHCEAGLGRTGTMIAVYLISQGASAEVAIRQIRSVERAAIETPQQIHFLERYVSKQSEMTALQDRLVICGLDEIENYRASRITRLLSVNNPNASAPQISWFSGQRLNLCFGDVVSEADAVQCRTRAPTIEDLKQAVEFLTSGLGAKSGRVLVHCDYGASRSPALAYVAVAKQLGEGREADALQAILAIRPCAVPNKLVVQLGDTLLIRQGALIKPLNRLFHSIAQEIKRA